MNSDRRTFIRNAGLLALSVPVSGLIPSISRKLPADGLMHAASPRKLPAFGIQLYMVRDEMEKDASGTLTQLASMGYTQLESYGGSKGMFWGMSNQEFKQLCAGMGLSLVSSHYNETDMPFEKQANLAAEIGMKYLICPWKGPQKSIDAFKQFALEFNQHGEVCKKLGLGFGYHPHDYPYKKVDGQLPIDVLLHETDPGLVDFEMDFYYTVTEGQDPAAYIKKYKNRFRLCHMRDVMKHRLPPGSADESATDLGLGIINYPKLLEVGLENGMQYFFVEQSRYDHETQLESARVNAEYMKHLVLV